jgi:putative oxidoreductase
LPAPDLMAYLAGLAEFGGGLFLAMGLFTRGAALAIIFDLAVALLMVHKAAIFGGPGVNGGELAWIYLLSAVLIAAKGPGKYSLDRKYRLDNK